MPSLTLTFLLQKFNKNQDVTRIYFVYNFHPILLLLSINRLF